LLVVGPALWFAKQVLRPLRELSANARRLVSSGPTIQRLNSAGGIPELRELAAAFNQGLDQVHRVTGELEAANDQLAHELRTPLARIRGNIEKVLSLSDSPLVGDHAARAISEIERATRLVQAILTIRAGEARTLKLHLGRVRLDELVATTVDLYAAAAADKGVGLRQEGGGSGLAVWGDGDRLQQALCNLLDNALAYTPQGGHVQVTVRGEGGFGVISVADTGVGLIAADLDRIWQRFARGSAASAEVPGIGLGLSVVRSIVGAHEGEAEARNRPAGGAEFLIRIPLATSIT
jgi:signal transduction histidine kinase